MGQGDEVHNEVGSVVGTVVQAGTIDQIVMHPAAPRPPVPRQLPGRVRDFSGRQREIAALDRGLPEGGAGHGSAVVQVLHGTAGVGKSTLAIRWAHRVRREFPDGTLFADLRGFGPGSPAVPSVVLAGFLAALGVPDGRIPVDVDAQSGLYRSLLAERRVLVLLDNAADAEQVRPLLPAGPGCLALVTSRKALHGLAVGEGATLVPVDLLDADEAFELVAGIIGGERAHRERAAVAELVEACARLPLALRVAATRVTSSGFIDVADVVREIRRGLAALERGGDERSAITSVFDWSYRRLPAAPAGLFRLLGLHPAAEFGTHAAAALVGGGLDEATDLLGVLADEHLVEQVGRRRFRVHDLLHAYAASLAAGDPARGAAVDRLLNWYAHAADAADALLFPGQPRLALPRGPLATPVRTRAEAWEWLAVEHTTLVATRRLAVRRGLTTAVVLLAGAARHLPLGRRALWRDRLDAEHDGLRAAQAVGDHAAEAFLLVRRGNTHRLLGDYDAANTDFRAVLDRAENPERRCEALCGLGSDGRDRGRPAEALVLYEAALPVARSTGDVLAEATVVCNIGQLNAALGRFGQALVFARRQLALRREVGDALGVGYAWHDVAVAHQGLGEDDVAIESCLRALAAYADDDAAAGDRAASLETMATSLIRVGRPSDAAVRLCQAAGLLSGLGAPRAEELRRWADGLAAGGAAG
ncbi:tetratricopeptide repeat protein [Saccharothrix sp. S26]|uniref:ATP-binding protein n=1 Tax=Saccharothrix sp. S26 TaxID=2907215 RepID=UPI001F25B25D|nr:tetratricopeptide repeat protein [Saccharothrix sp. S26]MCE6995338.1 tetratricopeptide repeat protein [Saccharothrix sp. S26]